MVKLADHFLPDFFFVLCNFAAGGTIRFIVFWVFFVDQLSTLHSILCCILKSNRDQLHTYSYIHFAQDMDSNLGDVNMQQLLSLILWKISKMVRRLQRYVMVMLLTTDDYRYPRWLEDYGAMLRWDGNTFDNWCSHKKFSSTTREIGIGKN